MTDPIDARLRSSNVVRDDLEVPPVGDLLERIDRDASRRRRRWRHPLALIAVGLALTSTAAATVVAVTDGPSTRLTERSTRDAPAVGRISGLLERFDPDWNDRRARSGDPVPELGDGGPITGTTFRREGFDIDVVSDSRKICFTAHLPGRPVGGLGCTDLPIPFDTIPLAAGSDGPRPTRRLFFAIGPDGVSDFAVTVPGGVTHRADFIDNVAAVAFDGDVEPERWSWTLPDGRRAVQQSGGRFRLERP